MNAQSLDWSDIPFVLAVCETGSLSGAARRLGVNHSTVFRRIEGVEEQLGVALFERLSHGYVMTAAGELFLKQGLDLEAGVNRIQRELGGQDLRLEGPLTVTTTDSLLYLLAPVFELFQNRYPDIRLQILTGTRSLDLMQRDADVALRSTLRPPDHWIGRNLSSIAFATYARVDYFERMKSLSKDQYRWIRLVDDLNQSSMNRITADRKADGVPVTIASSLMGMFDLVRSGLGIAALPCYLGEQSANLKRIDDPEAQYNSDLWILAHPDLHKSARVHAFFEYVSPKIKQLLLSASLNN